MIGLVKRALGRGGRDALETANPDLILASRSASTLLWRRCGSAGGKSSRRRISQFIETLVRPHVVSKDLLDAYREMASDERREAEAADWAEATVSDVAEVQLGLS